jgi:hypothetical protein
MGRDSESRADVASDQRRNDKTFELCARVSDIREELGRRIQRMSAKSAQTIADQLELAYYQNVLSFYEPLSPKTRVHSGFAMWRQCSDHQREVWKINQILDYLIGGGTERRTTLARSVSLALPVSARSIKKGRPVTRRPVAVRALQMKIDTGKNWLAIAQEVCDCKKKKHDKSCREAIRQSVISLRRSLKNLGIELSEDPTVGVENHIDLFTPCK